MAAPPKTVPPSYLPTSDRRHGNRVARIFGAAVLALCAGAGCHHGEERVVEGEVNPADLCAPTPATGTDPLPPSSFACPPCSTEDTAGACRDQHYATGVRCTEGDGRCERGGGACRAGLCVFVDNDKDGLDDDLEREVAERNLPDIHQHPEEPCGGPRGIVYRVRRHPEVPSRLAVTYVVLFDRDCGVFNPHIGDNEAFALTVDLNARPGAPATVGLRTVAHRNTACESASSCRTALGTSGCAPAGADRIRLYSSRGKHALYFDRVTCASNCFDECASGAVDPAPHLVDVGQPDAPLVKNLSQGLFVTEAGGWHASLYDFNPWSGEKFGGAGRVSDQLLSLLAPPGL